MTMTCESCRERLVDHHYGELDLPAARETAEHLSDCAACALEYCRLSAALAGFRDLARDVPRPQVHRALRAKVRDEFRPPLGARLARLFTARVPIYQPLLVVLLLFFLWTLMRGLPARDPSATTVLERFDATRVEVVDDHVL